MKIYTKTGDRGETGLIAGRRVPKDDPLLEAYGTVDELNSVLGVVRAESLGNDLDSWLAQIQNELFDVGADLAAPWDDRNTPAQKNVKRVDSKVIQRLEDEIDRAEALLKPLQQFILPGGSRAAALLHQARTICRRAERSVVKVSREGRANPEVTIYLNRLADWLFVMARYANLLAKREDVVWKPAR